MATPSSDLRGEKTAPIISVDEVQWLTALGLGRGVDATKPNLWKEKSSFQVQLVSKSLDNIIATDEGGEHHYYEREVLSICSRQAGLKLSVHDPNTSIHMGMDTLYSQSLSKSKKSIGEQVITRTISFRNTFDDLPLQHINEKVLERMIKHKDIVSQSSMTPTSPNVETEIMSAVDSSFEEKLSEWLLDRISGREESTVSASSSYALPKDAEIKFGNFAARLSKYLHMEAERDNHEKFQNVVRDCVLFIEITGVTHYVHSIQLGAMRFHVLNSMEYNKKVSIKGSVGVEKFAKTTLNLTASGEHKVSSKSLSVKKIGQMTDSTVKRGKGDEAVIGFKLMPIQRLVKSHHVNEALKQALQKYITKRAVKSKGPFTISCGSAKMRLYWKVEDSNRIIATPEVENASKFFLTSTDDEEYPYEFMICYYGEDIDEDTLVQPIAKGRIDPISKKERVTPLALYLNGTASILGYNEGPLEVKPNVHEENARFVLHNRVFDGQYKPVDFNSWMLGEEFFVNCSRRRFRWDGYVAVKKTKLLDFIVGIVPSQKHHNGVDTWLLFHLVPVQDLTSCKDCYASYK